MRSFIFVVLMLLSLSSYASQSELRAVVSNSNAPPYALFDQNSQLVGGVSKALLENLATRSGLNLHFLPLPRGRVEQWLLRNEADIACFLNPQWMEHPSLLAWSPALFQTRQVIVRRANSPAINQLSDLLGKRIGTERGFSYPEFNDLFLQRLGPVDLCCS